MAFIFPAEIPIELILAINNNLFSFNLKELYIYRDFLYPFNGKKYICWYDINSKDEYIMRGIINNKEED